jgi:hypothetical protein
MAIANKPLVAKRWEYIVPVLAVASLLVSCVIISSKKLFWNDELYSYYFLSDPSFPHMLGAFHDKINNTPPLYFLLGWLWARVFGSSEVSLRLFSSLGMCLACVVIWIVLRRAYSFWPASIGVLCIFCTSSLVLSQNAEARMYGLFLFLCSLAFFLYDSINRNSNNNHWSTLLLNTCVHAGIVHTHLFGLFYSGAIACSLIARDRYFNLLRPKVYYSIVLGWLTIILYIPSFINQSDAGNPRTWIPIPTVRDLIDVLSFSLLSFQSVTIGSILKLTILLLIAFVSGWQILNSKTSNTATSQLEQQNCKDIKAETSFLLFAYAFLAVPIFIWIISRTIKPMFWDRYLIPSVLSWAILFAHLSSKIIFNFVSVEGTKKKRLTSLYIIKQKTVKSIFLIGLSAALLVQPIHYARTIQAELAIGLNDNKYGYQELPIAMQFSHDFLKRFHYSPEKDRYFFILDWQVALDSSSGLFPPQEYKHLEALKRRYPKLFKNNIITSEEFLSTYERFLVLSNMDYTRKCTLDKRLKNGHCSRWLSLRLMNNPRYKVTSLGNIDNRKLFLVEPQK